MGGIDVNDNKLFTVKTSMGKEDYHKFLYIATFLRSKMIIPFILLISALMAAFLAYSDNQFSVTKFIALWILLAMVAILTIILRLRGEISSELKLTKQEYLIHKKH